jgi:hypothetical protein
MQKLVVVQRSNGPAAQILTLTEVHSLHPRSPPGDPPWWYLILKDATSLATETSFSRPSTASSVNQRRCRQKLGKRLQHVRRVGRYQKACASPDSLVDLPEHKYKILGDFGLSHPP